MLQEQVLPVCKWYPAKEDVFKVFRMPVSEIKVVILGQDPYHDGSANGYAFAVNKETKIPPSLKVIKEEIVLSGVERQGDPERVEWRTLQHWRQQGVFLLNTALTVPVGNANGHTGQWMWFTRQVIEALSTQVKVVWMLWGSKAQAFDGYILGGKPLKSGIIDGNILIYEYHPAAQTHPNAEKKYYFTGTNVFKNCNALLKARGQNVINW